MEYILVAIFASAFVLVIFWFVGKTVGKLRVVKNSPTLDDIQALISPGLAAAGASAHEERSLNAEYLPETVRDLADAGDKLAATKAYKDQMGVNLIEAKKAIEGYLNNR